MLRKNAEEKAGRIRDRLLDHLSRDDHPAAAVMMREIGTLGVKVPDGMDPKIAESHRHGLIKAMLEIIRDVGTDDGVAADFLDEIDLEMMVRGARFLGIAWPELDIMSKSIASDLKRRDELAEADDDEGVYGRDWRARLEFGEHLSSLVHDLKIPDNWDMLALHLEEMGYLDIETVLSEYNKKLILANEKQIIRSILFNMKEMRNPARMLKAVLALNNLGFNWPELDIIRKSLEADQEGK